MVNPTISHRTDESLHIGDSATSGRSRAATAPILVAYTCTAEAGNDRLDADVVTGCEFGELAGDGFGSSSVARPVSQAAQTADGTAVLGRRSAQHGEPTLTAQSV